MKYQFEHAVIDSCEDCPFCEGSTDLGSDYEEYIECYLREDKPPIIKQRFEKGRPKECPLIEIKENE